MRPTMIFGLSLRRTSGPRPSFSSTPGRNGSITTSACGMRALIKETPDGDFRSTAMEDLCRVRRSPVGGGRLDALGVCVKFGIERSIRRTEAPLSARRRPAKGPRIC